MKKSLEAYNKSIRQTQLETTMNILHNSVREIQ